MPADIEERLRALHLLNEMVTGSPTETIYSEAAAEIRRLRAALAPFAKAHRDSDDLGWAPREAYVRAVELTSPPSSASSPADPDAT